MNFIVEAVSEAIYAMRLATATQWVLRVLMAGALLGVTALCFVWFPILPAWLFVAVIALAALWSVAQPESWAPLVGIGAVVMWWLAGAAEAAWWQSLTVAVLLALFHLLAGVAAAAPSYTTIRPTALRGLSLRGLAYLGLSAAAAALVLAVTAIPADVVPRGPVWVALAVVAVTGAGTAAASRLTR